jgi:F-type H+-transporting ATPase subunit alpha
VEILKQPQYAPMPVEKQVMSIFAVTHGYLDGIEVKNVRLWEREFQEAMDAQAPQLAERIRTEKALSKDTEAQLRQAIERFTQDFVRRTSAGDRPAASATAH